MKVALVGYGKMGKEIEKLLAERGHSVVARINKENPLTKETVKDADVAIEFSSPHIVLENLNFLLENHIPTVVGTTGWYDDFKRIQKKVEETNGSLVYATNFSIGVNLFFKLNEQLAKLMNSHPQYTPEITEIHHTEKLDAPSGTAISLAQGLLANYDHLEDWYCLRSDRKNQEKAGQLEITAIREHDVKGTHQITYKSSIDTIKISHEAHNRRGFAWGAIIAAEWLQNKTGIFTMKDVLQLS